MRVLMLAIRYDHNDWATHFITKWAVRLAAQVDALDVLALEVGEVGSLPNNMRVFSMGKERGIGRAARLATFYRQAIPLIARCDAIFVHMIPRYALLAAPIARPLRKPITLWYTHRNPSTDLRRALPHLKQVLTAVPTSFPLSTDKLNPLGHGIDIDFYPFTNLTPAQPPTVVHVARLQPIKHQDALLTALTRVPQMHAAIIGAVPDGEDPQYAQALHQQAQDNELQTRVRFTGGLSPEAVREWYGRAAVAVNLSPPGLFDKAALESMACGLPTLVTNAAFADLMGEWRPYLLLDYPPKPPQIADRLEAIHYLSHKERSLLSQTLRRAVAEKHSLDALIPRLAAALRTTTR